MALFDARGDFLESVHRSDIICDLDGEEFEEYLKQELGFTPGLIRIKEFRLPGDEFALSQLPTYYQEFLRDSNAPAFSDEDRRELPTVIGEWLKSGQCVLENNQTDFWLDCTGQVVAS
jgi:hypothetical protein